MTKASDNPAANRPKISITECNLLVDPSKSRKLADIRKKFQPVVPVETPPLPETPSLPGLKPEVAIELDKARHLIDERIHQIMQSFPEGKKNKLFSFRFGSIDALKAMDIKAAFKLLGIDDASVKMKLLAGINFHGDQVKED